MRKSRTVIKGIEGELHRLLAESPSRFFDSADALEFKIPSWANAAILFIPLDDPRLEVAFFEDASQEFIIYYTRRMIERPPRYRLHCFTIDQNTWKTFIPPTLIGRGLKTKFRF